MTQYQAGARNINVGEVRLRRYRSIIWITLAGLLLIWLVAVDAPSPTRILVAIPLFFGILNALAVRNKFCARYGIKGVQNVSKDSSHTSPVIDLAARETDKKLSLQLCVQAALLTIFLIVLATIIL